MFYLYVVDSTTKRLTIFQPAIRIELASEVLRSWACSDNDSVCGMWPASRPIPSWLLSSSLLVSFQEFESPFSFAG